LKKRNQSGFLLIDFLFALLLGTGFAAVVFAISYGFSMVEVAQYIAFSSARSFLGANVSIDAQREAGQAKFDKLTKSTYLATVPNSPFFEIDPPEFDDHGEIYGYQPQSNGDSSRFVGARMRIQVNILAFNWPLLGSAGSESEFEAFITAFPGREPTFDECRSFIEQRFELIRQLDTRFSTANTQNYIPMWDNGC
jgi:hypothetical protein